MKHVKKSVLLWYSPREMYTLVTAVPDYPQFLPWCERAEVLEQHDGGMTARLHLAYAGVRHAFTTRNSMCADASVRVELVDGPFSLLEGTWRFVRWPARRARGAGLQDRVRPALCVPKQRSKRCSARCSTASPTPSSIPS